MDEAKRILDRLSVLEAERMPHEGVWRDGLEYSAPSLMHGFQGHAVGSAAEVQAQKAKMLDGTATDALVTSADGCMGGITPSNSRWFGLDIGGEESQEERRWLDESAQAVWEAIHGSNFDAEAHDAMKSLIGIGWAVLYIDEDETRGGYYFEQWPASECYIASTRRAGIIDTVYRPFEVPVSILAHEYGEEKISEESRALLTAGKVDQKVRVVHAIEPRREGKAGAKKSTELPFRSIHVECKTKTVLRESGYHEFPCAIPRWSRLPGSAYATGPMSDALPDVRTLNEVKRWTFAAAETNLAPPMKVVDDGVLNVRAVKLGPRTLIPVASLDSIAPLVTGARVDFGQMVIADLQASVRRHLMADLFGKMLEDPRMTATQVHAIVAMLRQRMGPRFGRLESEYLQALVERCFGLALRAGALGRPPESLLQRDYTVRYLSPLARAQKMEDVTAMEMHEQSLMVTAQSQPDIMDTYLWDDAARHKAELRGVPARFIPDAKAVAARRDERAEAQAEAQQQQIQTDAQATAAQTMAAQAA